MVRRLTETIIQLDFAFCSPPLGSFFFFSGPVLVYHLPSWIFVGTLVGTILGQVDDVSVFEMENDKVKLSMYVLSVTEGNRRVCLSLLKLLKDISM